MKRSKLTIKTPIWRQWRCSGFFVVNFKINIIMVFTLSILEETYFYLCVCTCFITTFAWNVILKPCIYPLNIGKHRNGTFLHFTKEIILNSCRWFHAMSQWQSLREKCPNKELFLVRIFLYTNWIKENRDQK